MTDLPKPNRQFRNERMRRGSNASKKGGSFLATAKFWTIELDGGESKRCPKERPYYHCIRDGIPPGLLDWTTNIMEALWFTRRVDAERYLNWTCFGSERLFIREHLYSYNSINPLRAACAH